MLLGIHNIHLGYSDGPLDQVCLPDCLKYAGEGAYKLHGLWDDLTDCGLIHTRRPLFGLFQYVENETRPAVLLGNHHNTA